MVRAEVGSELGETRGRRGHAVASGRTARGGGGIDGGAVHTDVDPIRRWHRSPDPAGRRPRRAGRRLPRPAAGGGRRPHGARRRPRRDLTLAAPRPPAGTGGGAREGDQDVASCTGRRSGERQPSAALATTPTAI